MEKRRSNRTKHRLTCELQIGLQRHPAVVRDLGPTGLFVQTRARPDANSVVEVRFPPTAGLPGFCVEAGVARHRNVHPRLQSEIHAGIGLEILGRPNDYLALASRVGGVSSTWGPRAAAGAASRPGAALTPPTALASAPPAAPTATTAPTSTTTPVAPTASVAPTVPASTAGADARAPRSTLLRDGATRRGGPELRRYRVRLRSHGVAPPRTLEVQASSLATARALAMMQAGAGWKITDIQTI